jgi:hypothetical protein
MEEAMKKIYSAISVMVCLTFCTGIMLSQSTDIKLSTLADSSSNFRVLNSADTVRMQVNSDGGLYVGGIVGSGVLPYNTTGTRMLWYPRKAAFRAGYTNSTQWSDANIGNYSTATGANTQANGSFATALGYANIASGDYSTAIGSYALASGGQSTAMGYSCHAEGNYSIALGSSAYATGNFSTALGPSATATTIGAIAIGNDVTASGTYSTAMGTNVTTNGYYGSFIIGDHAASVDSSTANNEMFMRFAGGYKLFTNWAKTAGVYMGSGSSGWTAVSDRNKKENFCTIDGEKILEKIRSMPITEWNYIGTDPSVKYIGPVAQDFYAAFHLGGTDSLGINSICIDGVNIAAIQALEKRTAELQKANEKIALMEQQNFERDRIIANLSKRIEELSGLVSGPTVKKDSDISNDR